MSFKGYPPDLSNTSVVTWELDSKLSDEQRVLTEGSNVSIVNDGTNIIINTTATGEGAPRTASYVTMGTESELSAERRLAEGNGITITDNGPNSTVDIGLSSNLLNLPFLTVNNVTLLTGERRLSVSYPLQTMDNGANSTFLIGFASAEQNKVLISNNTTIPAFSYGTLIGVTRWSGGGIQDLTTSSNGRNSTDCSGGSFIFNLPNPTICTGKVFSFKKTDNSINTITIGTDLFTIDGLSDFVMTGYMQSTVVYSDGTQWLIE